MDNRKKGAFYEEQAASYLMAKGYRIMERNFRFHRVGEIDLIACAPDGTLVFVEVKYRRDARCGSPLEAVDLRKQRQISRVALCYLMKKQIGTDASLRFDVIGIDGDGQICHIENAFLYSGR